MMQVILALQKILFYKKEKRNDSYFGKLKNLVSISEKNNYTSEWWLC